MKAKIQEKHRHKFTPSFTTRIGGVITKVTLSEAENNAEKYIATPIGVLYENWKKIKEAVASRQPVKEFEKLDMDDADSLGDIFDEEKRNKEKEEIENFVVNQTKRRARLQRKAERNLEKQNAKKDAEAKAEKDAKAKKDAEAKAKKDAEAKAKK